MKCIPAAVSLALLAIHLHAQTPAKLPEFDVASVKANKSNDAPYTNFPIGPGAVYTPNGGLFSAKNIPLINYIAFAWKMGGADVKTFLPQLPQWVLSDRFDIQARASGNPDKDTMRFMMRSLLAERFKLAIRNEKREIPVFAMTLATAGKTGPTLRLHTDISDCPRNNDPNAPPPTRLPTVDGGYPIMCGGIYGMPPEKPADVRAAARDITMEFLAHSLPATEMDRPIVDRTGLTGTVDFMLEWFPTRTGPLPPGATAPDPDQAGETFAEAIRKQLGIKLESTKAPVDTLVLDHIEHLIEN